MSSSAFFVHECACHAALKIHCEPVSCQYGGQEPTIWLTAWRVAEPPIAMKLKKRLEPVSRLSTRKMASVSVLI